MHNEQKAGFFGNLKYDIPSSIVVFLVALPLCLGIALASGAPLFSGIIAGIVGGLVVALASGSPLGVSGPAAGLAVIVLTSIQDLGAFDTFLLAVVVAGLIQAGLGFARAGIIGYYFPSSVIKGMLAGIGVVIFLKQIPHVFGYDSDVEGDFAFNQVDGHNTFSEIFYMFEAITPPVLIISAISLALLILWERPFMKNHKIFGMVQGPLVAVLTGIGLTMVFSNYPSLALSPDHLVSIPVAGSISEFFGQFTVPDFSQWNNSQVYVVAITIAVVASLETLLCVEATDKLDPFKRTTPTNRELKAQGLGNVVSGMIGGLPVTQVIVRSSANIQSGGRTKASAFFHGILLLVSVFSIPKILNLIPLGSLAAILLLIGYKLAKPALVRSMYRQGWLHFIPFMVTVLGIVFTDLLIGIGMGLAVGIFNILYTNYRNPYYSHWEKEPNSDAVRITLAEEVTFLNKATILRALNDLPNGSHAIIDATKSFHIDLDVLEIIQDFKMGAKHKDINLEVIGMTKDKVWVDPPILSSMRSTYGNGEDAVSSDEKSAEMANP